MAAVGGDEGERGRRATGERQSAVTNKEKAGKVRGRVARWAEHDCERTSREATQKSGAVEDSGVSGEFVFEVVQQAIAASTAVLCVHAMHLTGRFSHTIVATTC